MLTCAIVAGTLACTAPDPACQTQQDKLAEVERQAIAYIGFSRVIEIVNLVDLKPDSFSAD